MNEVTISDVLTQGMKVVDHTLHLVIVVADVEVALLEGAELGVELQNKRLDVAEELSLSREPRLVCSLCRFPNDLMEFGGEGADDPCHHDCRYPIDRVPSRTCVRLRQKARYVSMRCHVPPWHRSPPPCLVRALALPRVQGSGPLPSA
jgi:hypothetical protein